MTTVGSPPRHGTPASPAEPPRPPGYRPVPPPRLRKRPSLVWPVVVWSMVFLFVLSGAVFAYALWFSALPQGRAQEDLYNQLRYNLSQGNAPADTGDPIAPGTAVVLLQAPSIGLSQVVVEGTSSGDMMDGPGHRRDSPLPGQPGASVIYGHDTEFGAPFANITRLRPGDDITATTWQGEFTYRVTAIREPGDPLPAPLNKGQSLLTLATAQGTGWREGWVPNHVVYVDAMLQGDSQLPPPGRVLDVDDVEKPMQGDQNGFITLVLWLQALAVTVAFAFWARKRWSGPQTWLIAGPVLVAAVWGAAASMAVLLPNLA
jgi:sortase A